MGLNRRKKSGRTIGGSRLIVDGQPIFSVTKYVPELKKTSKPDISNEESELTTTTTTISPTTTTTTISPTTTTTTTISCNLVTQQFENLITQNGNNLVFC
jgi:hypothetical protein